MNQTFGEMNQTFGEMNQTFGEMVDWLGFCFTISIHLKTARLWSST